MLVTDFFYDLISIKDPKYYFEQLAPVHMFSKGLKKLPAQAPFRQEMFDFLEHAETRLCAKAYQQSTLQEYAVVTYKLFLQILSDYQKQRLAEIAAGEDTPVINSADVAPASAPMDVAPASTPMDVALDNAS